MPPSYQVTPAILGGGRHGKSRSDPGRQAKESQPGRPRAKPTNRTTPTERWSVRFPLSLSYVKWGSLFAGFCGLVRDRSDGS